jgi:AraC family transcriptional regulator, transcriptional activator of pobA
MSMKHYKSLIDVNRDAGVPLPENPLISLVECTDTCVLGKNEFTGDFYMIGFKKMKSGVFLYGRTKYDHDSGVLSFVKPRQVIQFEKVRFEERGFMILIHEDYLNGHPLREEIKKYSYFEYDANEALHLSPQEEQIIMDLFRNMQLEYKNNHDEYTREILLAHVESILKYSQRYYKRQFMNRSVSSGSLSKKFNQALVDYFEGAITQEKGLPTVKQLASFLNITPGYLSDMLKEETGKTALELIHLFLIAEAKNMLKGTDQNIAEVAYALGFGNLSYFSKLFKKEVGMSPNHFKKLIMN